MQNGIIGIILSYYYCIGNSRPPSVLLNRIFKLTPGEFVHR
jgi:hypothetical protein